jgi:HEAT repeat protein
MKKMLIPVFFLVLSWSGWCPGTAAAGGDDEPIISGRTLHEWVAALKDPDEGVRERAAWMIFRLGRKGRAAQPAVQEALKDRWPAVRSLACQALATMGPQNLPLLLDVLASGEDYGSPHDVFQDMGPAALPGLLEALRGDNPGRRRVAAQALTSQQAAARKVVPALRRALDDPDGRVCVAVAETLWRLDREGDAPVSALTAALKAADGQVRAGAATVLREYGPRAEAAVPALEQSLQDRDGQVRVQSAWALWVIDPGERETTLPVLTEALKDKEEDVCAEAVRALWQFVTQDRDAAKAARPALWALAQDWRRHRPGTVGAALEAARYLGRPAHERLPLLRALAGADDPEFVRVALGQLRDVAPGDPAVGAVVMKALGHPDARARAEAAHVAARLGRDVKPVLPALAAALKDPASPVRAAAAETCGELGPLARDLADPLAHLLEDPDPLIRTRAARALVRVDRRQGPVALPVLLRSLGSGDVGAWEGLQTLGGEAVAGTLKALEAEDPVLRRGAAVVLGGLGAGTPAVVVPALKWALKDTDPAVRAAAAGSLSVRGVRDSEVAAVLLERLGSRDLEVRNAAIGSLFSLGPAAKPAVPLLLRILADPDEGAARASAAELLGRVGEGVAGVEPALVATLASDDPYLRVFAASALTMLDTQDPRAFPPLVRLFADPDSGTRGAAEQALEHFGARAVPALLEMARDKDPDVRRAALNALLRARPDGGAQVLPW